MAILIDLTGRRFGLLVVVGLAPRTKRMLLWRVRCDCGTAKVVYGCHLRSGATKSCGCILKTNPGARRHGHWTGRRATSEHGTWNAMLQRCSNPKAEHYDRYGGRGITVCERWLVFENFLADMGMRPSASHSIDRRNNDGNYEPDNCHWATKKQQMRNTASTRLLTHDGKTQPLCAWAEQFGVLSASIASRLERGWSVADAITMPMRVTRASKKKEVA